MTEIDASSLAHAKRVVEENNVKMELIEVQSTDPILKPLFDGSKATWTICNPPFFSSREEMQTGSELKKTIAPSVSRLPDLH
jgi:23S rRNA A1618 N6-methylase RlmF